jgi:hypothetical protein
MTKLAEVLAKPERALPIVRVAAHMAWVDRRLVADEVSAARSVAV